MSKVLQPLSRGQLYPVMVHILQVKQKGLCVICGEPISLEVKGAKANYATDHDHKTGEIRGILHKSCNAAEGKVFNAAARWGAKSTDTVDVVAWLASLLTYYKESGSGYMYPDHKSPEQLKQAQLLKRRKAAAKARAVKVQKQLKEAK